MTRPSPPWVQRASAVVAFTATLGVGPSWGAPATPRAPAAAPATGAAGPAAPVSEDLKAQAAALYKEGAGLFKAGRFKEAAARFQSAYNLDPSPILLYNLARAAEELGDATMAVGHYKAYLARYPQAEDRAEVERRIRVLDAISKTAVPVGRLALTGVPAGSAVTIDGSPPPAPGADGLFALAPGRHVVKVTPTEGEPMERTIEVASATTSTLDLAAPAAGEGGGGRPLRLWGWVGTGVGVALAGVGAWFYADSFSAASDFEKYGKKVDALNPASPTYTQDIERYDQKSRDAQDRMDSDLLLGRVMLSVGGVAAAAGVTFLVLDAVRDDAPQTAIVPYPGGAGLVTTF